MDNKDKDKEKSRRAQQHTINTSVKTVPHSIKLVKAQDGSKAVKLYTRPIPIPPNTRLYRSDKASPLKKDQMAILEDLLPREKNVDRSLWHSKAMKRNPQLLALYERIRPLASKPSFSQLHLLFNHYFQTSQQANGGSGMGVAGQHSVRINVANGPSVSSFFKHPQVASLVQNVEKEEAPANGTGATETHEDGKKISRKQSTIHFDPNNNANVGIMRGDRSSSGSIIETVKRRNAKQTIVCSTEVKDVLTREVVLQLIMAHLKLKGHDRTIETIEKETGIKFNAANEFEVSPLNTLLSMSIKNRDNLFVLPATIFTDNIFEDSEVLTSNLYQTVTVDEDQEEDVKKNIWSDCVEVEGVNCLYTREKRDAIRAASLNLLISTFGKSDNKFQRTFLCTFRSFTTPEILLMKLIEMFMVPDYNPNNAEKLSDSDWQRDVSTIKLRVCSAIKTWLETFIFDFNKNMIRLLSLFIEDKLLKNPSTKKTGENLRRTMDKMLSNRSNYYDHNFSTEPPKPIIPIEKIFSPSLDVFDIDEVELARQITIVDHQLYRRIKPAELLNLAWNNTKLKHRATNVQAISTRFNSISAWVACQILNDRFLRSRRLKMMKIIKIIEQLRLLKNFSSMLAMCSGLNTSAVFRLQHTKNSIPEKHLEGFKVCNELMSSNKSFLLYRDTLCKLDPPCVPYLGMYLTDLVFIEEGNPDFVSVDDNNQPLPRRLINWSKRNMYYTTIGEIQQYQNTPYNLQPVYQIQKLLADSFEKDTIYDDRIQFQISLEIEPRETSAKDIQ